MPTENEPKIDQKIEEISSAQQHSEQTNGTNTRLQQNDIEVSRDKLHANEKATVLEKTNEGRDHVAGKPHTKQGSEKEKFIGYGGYGY